MCAKSDEQKPESRIFYASGVITLYVSVIKILYEHCEVTHKTETHKDDPMVSFTLLR